MVEVDGLADDVTRPQRWRAHSRCAGVLALVVCAVAVLGVDARQPPTLVYLERGGRSEGLLMEQRTPEAALTVVSAIALVKPVEEYVAWPKTLRLRFYLPAGQNAASAVVRQIPAPGGYYLLDKVTPAKPWVTSSLNEFEWPADLMQRIYDYQAPNQPDVTRDQWIAQLGVVVALREVKPGDGGTQTTSQRVTVAPATLYHSRAPAAVGAYQFTFRTNYSADVSEKVLSDAGRVIASFAPRSVDTNTPFTTRWLPADQPAGWYRLTLDASFRGAAAGLPQQWVVRFYHRPSLAG